MWCGRMVLFSNQWIETWKCALIPKIRCSCQNIAAWELMLFSTYLFADCFFVCVLENLDLSPFTCTWRAPGCWQWDFKIRSIIFFTKPDIIKTIQQPKISLSSIFWKSVCGHMTSSLLSTKICITEVMHVILARNVWKMGSLDMLQHLECKHIPKWFPWSLLFEHKNPTQWPTATNVEKLEKGINNLELLCLEQFLKFWSLMICRKRIFKSVLLF